MAGLSLLALPVVAQVRGGSDANSAMMESNAAQAATDAANAAAEAAMRAADAAVNATMLDNTVATDTTYDANADMSMDTNMSEDANSIDYVPPNYRFYRVAMSGQAPQQTVVYMDTNSVRRTNGLVRGWETEYYNYQHEHLRPGARVSRSLIEANCGERQTRFLTTTYYNRSGVVLNTIPESNWDYVIPDTVAETIYQFLCEDRRLFYGTFDAEADARATLAAERPARAIVTLPPQLRPRPRRP